MGNAQGKWLNLEAPPKYPAAAIDKSLEVHKIFRFLTTVPRMLVKFVFTSAATLFQEANNLSLLKVLGIVKKENKNEMDFIVILPEEVSLMILKQLNGKSLLACSLVNRSWNNFCNAQEPLQKRIEEEKRTAAIRRAFKSYERDLLQSIFLSLIYDFLFDIYQATQFFMRIPFRAISLLKS